MAARRPNPVLASAYAEIVAARSNSATAEQIEWLKVAAKQRSYTPEAIEEIEMARLAWKQGQFTKEYAAELMYILAGVPAHCGGCEACDGENACAL